MQNSLPKLRQTSPISKKPGFLSERLKILTSSNYHREFNIFCLNFAHVFYLVMSTKSCVRFFLFCLDLRSHLKQVLLHYPWKLEMLLLSEF